MKPFTFTIFLTVILISSSMAQSKGGRWQFENNSFDTADWDLFEDNGTLVDNAMFSQIAPLQEGASYLWLGTNFTDNYVKVEDSDDLDFTDENIGLSAWIYPVEYTDTHFFINKGVQNTNPKTTNYSLRISKSANLEFLIRDAGNLAQKVASSFTIPLDQWTFVAVYYDFQAHKVYMWNDPLTDAVDTLDFDQSFFANDGPLGIGAWYVNDVSNPSDFNFKGRMDDVRISGRKDDIIPKLTALKGLEMKIITSFEVKQNYPNPFNPKTLISFYLPQSEYVSLKIYDNQGREVITLLQQTLSVGDHQFTWDANQYASGVYYYQLVSANFIRTKKMLLLK